MRKSLLFMLVVLVGFAFTSCNKEKVSKKDVLIFAVYSGKADKYKVPPKVKVNGKTLEFYKNEKFKGIDQDFDWHFQYKIDGKIKKGDNVQFVSETGYMITDGSVFIGKNKQVEWLDSDNEDDELDIHFVKTNFTVK